MGKFYVESGQLRRVVAAASAKPAALNALRMAMLDDAGATRLSPELYVSERGFDRPEGGVAFETRSLLAELAADAGRDAGESEFGGPSGLAPQSAEFLFRVFGPDRCAMRSGGEVRILTYWGASGAGATVHAWRVEGEPLCVDVYGFETQDYAEAVGAQPTLELEVDAPLPPDDATLQVLLIALVSARSRGT